MRILVKCSDCFRRYDASKRKIGSRFRCHCGQVLTVHQPRSHEATVVRCTSCGGPRQQNAPACVFCGADFTTHERDLSTVCPDCLARVSDRARYCPQCSVKLGGETIVKTDSAFVCPACEGEATLSDRRLGRAQTSVLECGKCTGFWLSIDSFIQLRDRTMRQSDYEPVEGPGQPQAATVRQQPGPFYRRCIECRRRMVRRQYVRGCGIIIDVCRDHGIWFDADELQQTIQWHAAGGRHGGFLDSVRSGRREPPAPPVVDQARLPAARASRLQAAASESRSVGGQRDFLVDLFESLTSEVGNLFR